MSKIGPYSTRDALGKLDGRTRESRLLHQVKRDLTAHVGGAPSATQRILVDRAARLTLQVALLDAKHSDGAFTEHDERAYLAWTNTLTRLMRQLGMTSTPPRPRNLADHIASRGAA